MKNVSVAKINLSNPILTTYIKRIKSWESTDDFCNKIIKKQDKNDGFYGIYYDEYFLAASTIDYDSNNACVDISVINASNQHGDEIEQESREQLINIAREEYGSENVRFHHLKVKSR